MDGVLRALVLQGDLVAEDIGGETAVYLPRLHRAECETARLMNRLRASVRPPKLKPGEAMREIERRERELNGSLCA